MRATLPLVLALAAGPAAAEVEVQLYFGPQGAADSDVEVDEPGGAGLVELDVDWEGRSFEAPPHYGVRVTRWRGDLGFGGEFEHQKVHASDETLAASGFDRLEFTDGHNLLTAHVARRFPVAGRLVPYVGAGAGAILPWVEVRTAAGRRGTDELRLGGPAVVAFAGASYALTDRWALFGEVKGSYAWIDVDLEGGGTLETEVATGAVNLGASLRF